MIRGKHSDSDSIFLYTSLTASILVTHITSMSVHPYSLPGVSLAGFNYRRTHYVANSRVDEGDEGNEQDTEDDRGPRKPVYGETKVARLRTKRTISLPCYTFLDTSLHLPYSPLAPQASLVNRTGGKGIRFSWLVLLTL